MPQVRLIFGLGFFHESLEKHGIDALFVGDGIGILHLMHYKDWTLYRVDRDILHALEDDAGPHGVGRIFFYSMQGLFHRI